MDWLISHGWFGWAALIAAVFLGISAILTTVRIVRGPSLLDRIIASDVLLVTISCGLLVWMAVTGNFSTIPLVFLASVIGFLGAVTVARTTASATASQYVRELEAQKHREYRQETGSVGEELGGTSGAGLEPQTPQTDPGAGRSEA